MVDVVVRVGPIRTLQDLLFIRHAQVTAQKVISGFIKGFIENNHQLMLTKITMNMETAIKEKKESATGDGFLVFTIDGNTKSFSTYDKAIVEALAVYDQIRNNQRR